MGSCTTKPGDKRKQNLNKDVANGVDAKHKYETNNGKQQEVEGQVHEYGEVVVVVEMDHCNEGVEQMQFSDQKRGIDKNEMGYNTVKDFTEGSAGIAGVPKSVFSSGQKSVQTGAKRSNSCGGKQEDEATQKTGVQGKGQKQTTASYDQQSTTQFTGAHNDIFSKKDCTSSSETATTNRQKQKRCLMQSTHEQTGITLMIYEPTQNSVNEDENEGSFSINEMVEEENQEEEEENKNEKEKKSGLENLRDTNEENKTQKNEHIQMLYDDNQLFTIFYAIADRNHEDIIGSQFSPST